MEPDPVDKRIDIALGRRSFDDYEPNYEWDRILTDMDGRKSEHTDNLAKRIRLHEDLDFEDSPMYSCYHCGTNQAGNRRGFVCKYCHNFTQALATKVRYRLR